MSKTECKTCGAEFESGPKRGRPYEKCNSCRLPKKLRLNVTKKLTPAEIVDRLEMNLKANGTHISQHQDKW